MKRPEGMPFEEYKEARKAVNDFVKQRAKGQLIHVSKELDFDGEKLLVSKKKGNTYRAPPSQKGSREVQPLDL